MNTLNFNTEFIGRTGFTALKDGRLLALGNGLKGVVSNDGGRTWTEEYPILTASGHSLTGGGNSSIIRLMSGRIGIQYARTVETGPQQDVGLYFALSDDEGRTWSHEYRINLPGNYASPYHDALIQMGSGRLILPVRWCPAGSRAEHAAGKAMGTVNGERVTIAGHAHYPEIDIAWIYYSDDEGHTWQTSAHQIIGWPDDGRRGAYAVDEPTVAENADGRLVMFARSTLGRVLESFSEDNGETWTRALPNGLCNSYSPVRLRRIPTTGDLHCVWNQVKAAEIRAGYRRSRLTSAISRDGGTTWSHFKTLDCADTLDPAPYHKPDQEPMFVVADQECGEMPDNYCIFRYPNVCFVGNTIYISYDREPFIWSGSPRRVRVLRAMPIDLLYDENESDLRLANAIEGQALAKASQHIEE